MAVLEPMAVGVNWTVRSKVLVGDSVVGGSVTLNMVACVPVIAAVMPVSVSSPMLLSVRVTLTDVSSSAEPTFSGGSDGTSGSGEVVPDKIVCPACVTRSSGCGSARHTQVLEVTPPRVMRA